jgi:hypothetical protein
MSRAPGTLAEAIAAVVTSALLYTVVAGPCAESIPRIRAVAAAAHRCAEIAFLDAVLTDACGRVVQPVSLARPAVKRLPNGIRIGYVGALPGRELVVREIRGAIRVRTPDGTFDFPRLRLESVSIERAPIPRLQLTVRADARTRATVIAAPFAQFPPQSASRHR